MAAGPETLNAAVLLRYADDGAFLPSGVPPTWVGSDHPLPGSSPDPLAAIAPGKVQDQLVSVAQGAIVSKKNNADCLTCPEI